MPLASGHTYHALEGEELERITKNFPPLKTGLIRLSPGGWILPQQFTKFGDKLFNFEVRATDVYVMTYAKVGTTWTQEIVWTMRHNPNLDNPESAEDTNDRIPFLDADMFMPDDITPDVIKSMEPFIKRFLKQCPEGNPNEGIYLQMGQTLPDPRVLKTHLPLSLMPPTLLDKAKVVYVARNPRDVVCSYCHHCKLFSDMKFIGSLDQFCEHFMRDECIYSPYYLHVKEAWEKRNHPNMHVMLYEDMKADIMKELRKLNDFLGTNLTEEQLENVKKHTSFDEMKKRDKLAELAGTDASAFIDNEFMKEHGGFYRQGKAGDGKKSLSPEMLAKMDTWIKEHFNFGLDFD